MPCSSSCRYGSTDAVAPPMKLLRVATRGFRNLPEDVLDVDAPMVVFHGANGQGKTNWLEAVGVLGSLRSFRTSRSADMIAMGQATTAVEGAAESQGMTRSFRYAFGEGARSLRREERTVDALTWLSALRATWFVPADTAPIGGEPALRRAMLERAAFTIAPSYLSPARDLRRVLEHKAALLRHPSPDETSLDVLDSQLAALAERVTTARRGVVERISPRFVTFYEAFAGAEGASVAYRAHHDGDVSSWVARLTAARESERAARRPLVGPHRDDLAFRILDRPARTIASQGQARSLILAWKLAELDAARESGETPLFLVDDLGSELDPARTERLVALLGTLGAQIFLTTTDRRFVPADVMPGRYLRVEAGRAEPG